MEILETELQVLIDKKIVKKRVMETELDKYFAAQDVVTVKKLIEAELEIETINSEQRQKLNALAKRLSALQEDTE
jgi:hypothetical protein